MPEPIDTIYVDIVARLDKLEAGLRAAESKVAATTAAVDKGMAGGMGRAADAAARFGLNMARVVGTARVLESTLRATTVAIGLMSGDMQTFVTSMEQARQIPLVGAGVRITEQIADLLRLTGGNQIGQQNTLFPFFQRVQQNLTAERSFLISQQADKQIRAIQQGIELQGIQNDDIRVGRMADFARQNFQLEHAALIKQMDALGIPLSDPARKQTQLLGIFGQIAPYFDAIAKLEARRPTLTATGETAIGQFKFGAFGGDSTGMAQRLKDKVKQILESNKRHSEVAHLIRRMQGSGFF